MFDHPISYHPILNLDADMQSAMEKMTRIMEICDRLPGLDCGSCGAPTCRALAEDIVRGYATEDICIYNLKSKILDLVKGLGESSLKLENNEDENLKKGDD